MQRHSRARLKGAAGEEWRVALYSVSSATRLGQRVIRVVVVLVFGYLAVSSASIAVAAIQAVDGAGWAIFRILGWLVFGVIFFVIGIGGAIGAVVAPLDEDADHGDAAPEVEQEGLYVEGDVIADVIDGDFDV